MVHSELLPHVTNGSNLFHPRLPQSITARQTSRFWTNGPQLGNYPETAFEKVASYVLKPDALGATACVVNLRIVPANSRLRTSHIGRLCRRGANAPESLYRANPEGFLVGAFEPR